jgi:biopolymer transport protein ExbD
MKVPLPADKDEKIDITALVDIIFLLVVFFMTVSTALSLEKIELDIPVADQAVVPKEAVGRLTVNVDADGVLYVGMNRIELEDLPGHIERARDLEGRQAMKVYLRASQRTPYRDIQSILKVCAAAGVPDVIFGVTQVEVAPPQ